MGYTTYGFFLHDKYFFKVSFGGAASYDGAVQKMGMKKGKVECF